MPLADFSICYFTTKCLKKELEFKAGKQAGTNKISYSRLITAITITYQSKRVLGKRFVHKEDLPGSEVSG